MSTYAELQEKIAELQQQAEDLRRTERSTAIGEIKTRMAELGLTIEDLAGVSAKKIRRSSGSVAAKYYDPSTGKSWSGRGRTPTWLVNAEANGRSRTDFAV